MASQIGSLLRQASKKRKEKRARTSHSASRPAPPAMFPSLNSNSAPGPSYGASSSGHPGFAGNGRTSSAAAASGAATELLLQADGTSFTDLPRKAAWDGGNTKGGGAPHDGRRSSRDPYDESNVDHRIKATKAHRKWLKRHKIHDVLSASYYKSSKVPAGSNILLYVGLSVLMLGLIISFVGLGDKGFRTKELRLIGPCLAGFGTLLCILRMFFCCACCYARTSDECCPWPSSNPKAESQSKRPKKTSIPPEEQDQKDEESNLLGPVIASYVPPLQTGDANEDEALLHGQDNPGIQDDQDELPDIKKRNHPKKSSVLNFNDSLDGLLAEQNWKAQKEGPTTSTGKKPSETDKAPRPSRSEKLSSTVRQSSTTSLLKDELVLNAQDLKTPSNKMK